MSRFFLVSLFLLQFLNASQTVHAQGKKGGGGTTTLPNVRFEVQFLGTLPGDVKSSVGGMNEGLEIVGTSDDSDSQILPRAVRFTEFGVVDLNVEMADLLAARDDGPWHAYTANDINDLGQIVGTIKVGNSPTLNLTHTYIYDPGDVEIGRPRKLEILPLVRETTTRPAAINNLGQIAGTYSNNNSGLFGSFVWSPGGSPIDMGAGIDAKVINDFGQVVFARSGESLRYTPTNFLGDAGIYESFPDYVTSINLFGELVGSSRVSLSKNRYEYTAYRASNPNSLQVLARNSTGVTAGRLNDDSDVTLSFNGRPSLYTDMNNLKLITLDPLVVGTAASITKWQEHFASVRAMTNRVPIDASSSFPIMAGEAGLPSQGFILIPRLP